MRKFTILGSALLLLAGVNSVSAQTISGRVIDGDTRNQISAAEIMLVQIDSSARTITDSKGAFRFRAIPGLWTFRVKALGYEDLVTQPLQVAPGEHLSVVVVLTLKPLELPPVTVIGRSNRSLSALEEFERRRKTNAFGTFMDQRQIERIPAAMVSDILRRVPGAQTTHERVQFRGCDDALYLIDGMPVTGMGSVSADMPGQTATEWVNSIVSPQDIAAIEVYRGDAAIPAELMRRVGIEEGNVCGLVAIWTKRR